MPLTADEREDRLANTPTGDRNDRMLQAAALLISARLSELTQAVKELRMEMEDR